jgi:hypothetical protein
MTENNEIAEDYDGFMGAEHFEGLGDVWSALLGKGESCVSIVQKILAEGVASPQNHARYEDETLVALMHYPASGSIRAGALIVHKPKSEINEFYSAYPILEGRSNRLTIDDTHRWSNGVEGEVAAIAGGEIPVSFFAPFYFRDFAKFTLDTAVSVNLGALAFSLNQAEPQEFTIKEGGFYEFRREEFLEDNPGKTEADFSPPVISMRGAKIFVHSHYSCEFEFRCPVLAVEEISFMGIKIYKLTVDFVGRDDDLISGYLYASEHILHGYVPEVGHDVEGVLWMTGTICE